jgi:hypothetical protein
MNEHDHKFMARASCRQWLLAVETQKRRCLGHLAEHAAVDDVPLRLRGQRHLDIADASRVDEHFFVVALGNADKWLGRLATLEADKQPFHDRLLSDVPHLRDVRNMREHADEYFEGDGRAQDRFIFHTDELTADATGTIVMGDKYLLGGRLDLINAGVVAADILAILFPTNESIFAGLPRRI